MFLSRCHCFASLTFSSTVVTHLPCMYNKSCWLKLLPHRYLEGGLAVFVLYLLTGSSVQKDPGAALLIGQRRFLNQDPFTWEAKRHKIRSLWWKKEQFCQWAQINLLNSKGKQVFIAQWQIQYLLFFHK